MKQIRNIFSVLLLGISLMMVSVPSFSADLQKGLGAYYRGDYQAALREWRPLAEQGNADAQGNLGAMYAFGKGVLKDYVYAHMWANIAVSIGGEEKGKVRDFVEKKMTPSQLETAQNLARECVRKKYKGC